MTALSGRSTALSDADVERSRARIEADIARLSEPGYTSSPTGITRHAYTPEYRRTLEHFASAFEELGYEVHYDPVGTLVASNCAPGEPGFGLGSHCDANRNGGPYDGTLGVVCALELCRVAADRGLDLPLRVISFLEEEGSGFASTMLGSRIMLGRIRPDEIAALTDDAGTPFLDAAAAAGFEPERIAESGRELDGLLGWLELHIEQARVLEDRGLQLGVVEAIAGFVHADVTIKGRADHAGGTPMELRSDPLVTAGEVVAKLAELAPALSQDAVATVGSLEVTPGLINVIPDSVTFSLDLRSGSGDHLRVLEAILTYARERAAHRGQELTYYERTRIEPTPMDAGMVAVLQETASAMDVRWIPMVSGAAHDTMLVARRIPSAMVFVPCREGISHAPDEYADPADAAVATHLMLDALVRLHAEAGEGR